MSGAWSRSYQVMRTVIDPCKMLYCVRVSMGEHFDDVVLLPFVGHVLLAFGWVLGEMGSGGRGGSLCTCLGVFL